MRYFIGDIHGAAKTLRALVARILEADPDAEFICVGDYCDRGPDSKDVVDFLIEIGAYCVRGNHDDVIDFILNGQCSSPFENNFYGPKEEANVIRYWIVHGLPEFCKSYGIDVDKQTFVDAEDDPAELFALCEALHIQLLKAVPQEHKDFYRNLHDYYDSDTHFSFHAYFPPDLELPRDLKFLNLNDNFRYITLWSSFRDDHINSWPGSGVETKWDKIGVFGHAPTGRYGFWNKPISIDNIRLIDTAAHAGGFLTAYCAETEEFIQEKNRDSA